MSFYKVKNGNARKLPENQILKFAKTCDWENEILVVCENKDIALALAHDYDLGKIDGDNIYYPDCYGKVIKAIEAK